MSNDMPEGVKLTDKQQAFVNEYLIDLNATQAAIRAGYSEKTAAVIGNENLTKPYVADAIAKAQAQRSARVLVTQDDVIKGLLDEATNKDDGSSHGARVASWSHLGKHLGMFKDKVEHTGKDGADLFPSIVVRYE